MSDPLNFEVQRFLEIPFHHEKIYNDRFSLLDIHFEVPQKTLAVVIKISSWKEIFFYIGNNLTFCSIKNHKRHFKIDLCWQTHKPSVLKL